jgi:trehalose 6-phosphate synthase
MLQLRVAPLAAGAAGRHSHAGAWELVFESIQDTVIRNATASDSRRIDALFQNVTRDERLLAVGLCSPEGRLIHRSATWPLTLKCPPGAATGAAFQVEPLNGGTVLAAAFALNDADARLGDLVIVHDLSFIERRSAKLERYLTVFLAGLGLVVAATTVVVARLARRDWVRAVRQGLAPTQRGGTAERDLPPDIAPLVREMREMLRNLDVPRGISDAIRVDWTPDSLRSLLKSELPGAEVLVVSNREPYIHNQEGAGIRVQRPASGLVTALEPIVRACGGTWIAHGSGSADAATVDRKDHIQVPPEAPAYTLRRVWLSDEEQEGCIV